MPARPCPPMPPRKPEPPLPLKSKEELAEDVAQLRKTFANSPQIAAEFEKFNEGYRNGGYVEAAAKYKAELLEHETARADYEIAIAEWKRRVGEQAA